MAPSADHGPLPDRLEDAVLAILDGDESLRATALHDLLAAEPAHARAIRSWLLSAGVDVPADDGGPGDGDGDHDRLPRPLGNYVLTAKLGRGGFGTVYRAAQLEPIRRDVAIKILNPGMDSREVLARFAAEQHALNRMDHPGIARLYDAGTTPQGRPFFAMELVEGRPLAVLCRERSLPLRARLELFLLVLDAMQHAHQKAVLHRDLSSNNVLVAEKDGHLQPKIIDFGVAKSLAGPLLAGGAMTFQGTLMGTPEFMSPEQAAGRPEDVDTRTDVYALGVQLYELLTDQLPIPTHVLRAQGIAGIAAVVQEFAPAAPSAIAPADRRGRLAGDLDAITAKAMAKRRDDRYASVAEFAADLRRHLADEPVHVAMPSTWTRLKKLVRRHRVESAAIAILVLGLAASTGVLWWALSSERAARAELEEKKREIERRADPAFRLLANEELLRDAIATGRALPPPWPEHRAAYARWLADRGLPLAEELPKVHEKREALQKTMAPDGTFADMVDRHLYTALGRLEQELAAFTAPGGLLARVEADESFLQGVAEPALQRDAALWQRTIDEVRGDYRGLMLRPLPGLVPLGKNPVTRRQEFADLATRGCEPGIVFVLVPAGRFRIGAMRDEPGLAQNDPDAAADELHGESIQLDDFLLAKTELTAAQWAALQGPRGDATAPGAANPGEPAGGIDYDTARSVLARWDLDLPTEAQWEYACRAGTTTPWATAEGAEPAVAFGYANAWGLIAMHGGKAEWCRDEKLIYGKSTPRPGDGLRSRPTTAADAPRVVRGGAAGDPPEATRSSARAARVPTTRDDRIGVRPVRRLR
ncbi:MAG: bifunctional serine/threonine-protein kinase/formylglycine-generating enzyme family protein [Planctomycetota bacterium]